MPRNTIVRPPTEKITEGNGELTQEWSEFFTALSQYIAEQQKDAPSS